MRTVVALGFTWSHVLRDPIMYTRYEFWYSHGEKSWTMIEGTVEEDIVEKFGRIVHQVNEKDPFVVPTQLTAEDYKRIYNETRNRAETWTLPALERTRAEISIQVFALRRLLRERKA